MFKQTIKCNAGNEAKSITNQKNLKPQDLVSVSTGTNPANFLKGEPTDVYSCINETKGNRD